MSADAGLSTAKENMGAYFAAFSVAQAFTPGNEDPNNLFRPFRGSTDLPRIRQRQRTSPKGDSQKIGDSLFPGVNAWAT
jgi:hypothetical protein